MARRIDLIPQPDPLMRRTDLEAALLAFLHEQFPAARGAGLSAESPLLENGILDSMGVMEVVAFLEERLGVALTDDELVADHFGSVRALADLVHPRLVPGP